MSLNDLAYKGVNYLKMKCQDYYLEIIVPFVQGIGGYFCFPLLSFTHFNINLGTLRYIQFSLCAL